MHPAATIFLDVCVQADLWPGGTWPLMAGPEAANVARLFALAERFALRQGGIVCRHDGIGAAPALGTPAHCATASIAEPRPGGCAPRLPVRVWTADDPATGLDRASAVYVPSGCGEHPDAEPERSRVISFLTSGVRDAVVFGAGVETGLAFAVDALLGRRIRTHVALDAVSTADAVAAQGVVSRWKRRGVDGATVDTIARLLAHG